MRSIVSAAVRQILLFAAGWGLLAAHVAVAQPPRFDISYLWHRNLAAVYDYSRRVAPVLGPAVAADLRVVKDGDLFGLVYHRRGDSGGAQIVARAHSRLLRARGLEEAMPVPSRAWTFVGEDGVLQSSSVALAEPSEVAQTPVDARAGAASAPKTTNEVSSAADAATGAAPGRPEPASQSGDLEAAVEVAIKALRRAGKIAPDERTGWSVYDFTTGQKLVTINEDVPFQAASLIKPFFAAAFFHRVERGEISYGTKSRRHMEQMIQRSNNISTNWVLRRVGGPKAAQRILKQFYGGVFRDTHIVEYIPRGGRTYRNKASISDYSRFLYAVWNDQLPGAREIKRLMALPGPDRIYTGVRALPVGTEVYNKTGSTARLCGDMGIIIVKDKDGRRYPYTLIGVIEKRGRARNYAAWIRARADVIRSVSNIVYRGITQRHNLEGA